MHFRFDAHDTVKAYVTYEINFIDRNEQELTMWIDRIERTLVDGEVSKVETQPISCVAVLKADLKRLAKAI